ncbi:MAG: response regulator [Elusimicrobia bacterium]|nr:response regulator [Elusimicrobiota bacterium]
MPSILIIDDDPTILLLFKYVFSDNGFEVYTAGNGQEALEKISEGAPDFMLVDIAMPVMNGAEFIEKVEKLSAGKPQLKKIPFIVMTGENFMESGINLVFQKSPGFRAFVPKMTQPEQVLAMVNEILKK